MSYPKIFLVVFLCGFLLFGFLYTRGCVQYKKDRLAWETEIVELNRDLTALDGQIAEQVVDITYWKGVATEKSEEVVEIQTELAIERRAHAQVLAGISELAPDEVVTQLLTILHLPSSEITLTPSGVVFSLDATYLMLTNMYAFDYNRKVETPRLNEIIILQQDSIVALNKMNLGWLNTTNLLYKEIAVWEQKYEGEHKLRFQAESTMTYDLFSTKNVLIGVGVTVVIVGTLFLLK